MASNRHSAARSSTRVKRRSCLKFVQTQARVNQTFLQAQHKIARASVKRRRCLKFPQTRRAREKRQTTPPSIAYIVGKKAKRFDKKRYFFSETNTESQKGAFNRTEKGPQRKSYPSSLSPPSGMRMCAIRSPPRRHTCVCRLSRTLPWNRARRY